MKSLIMLLVILSSRDIFAAETKDRFFSLTGLGQSNNEFIAEDPTRGMTYSARINCPE